MNDVGAGLGATSSRGRYRGTMKHAGLAGFRGFPSNYAIVVEVKTADAYRIDPTTIAGQLNSGIRSPLATLSQSLDE